MFWALSISLLLLTGLLTLWPLLSKGSTYKPAAWVVMLVLPVAAYFLYQQVGTPQALDLPQASSADAEAGDMNALTEQLRSRLEEEPDNVEGWVLLGRSYKTLQMYPQALAALENANRLAPGEPLVAVELVEAQLFVSGNPRLTVEMTQALEQAVAVDPGLQKGLWLLGIAAAQVGDDVRAIEWWTDLSAQLEPGSSIAVSVEEQIAQARTRLGMDADLAALASPANTAAVLWKGLDVLIEMPATLSPLPDEAVVYLIAREQGAAGGPPLGASRITQPVFPLQVTLTDENSMMPQRPISSATMLTLQARLSMNGQPIAAAGDLQSNSVSVAVEESDTTVTLILAQPVD